MPTSLQARSASTGVARRCTPVLVALTLALHAPVIEGQLPVGTRAPDIALRSIDGARVHLASLRGRPVILTFWGTWCAPCRDEFPQLVTAYRTYHGAGLEILAVNQRDQETDDRAVRVFGATYGVTFPILIDPNGRLRRTYRIVGLPTTVFVDTAGTIMLLVSGPVTPEVQARGLKLILPRP